VDIAEVFAVLRVKDMSDRLALVDARITETLSLVGGGLAVPTLRVAGSGGKRLRPALTIACADIGGVFDDRVVSAAAAVELVQVGSLIHDDIFEGAPTRRGVPTINGAEGAELALLAGDFVLARAGVEVAKAGTDQAQVLADTIVALCAGQVAEMHDVGIVERTVESYLGSIAGKTATLFATSCQVGALCAGLSGPEVESLTRFGHEFGMAFQILDDVLDITADPLRLGKPVGIDVKTGVYIVPVLIALEHDPADELRHLLSRRTPNDVLAALEIVGSSNGIPEALAVMREHADLASRAIDHLTIERARGLYEFPASYTTWALDYFAGTGSARDTG
jgi:geranylgeranyl pyrophosphate synthase